LTPARTMFLYVDRRGKSIPSSFLAKPVFLRYIDINMSVNQGFDYFIQWHLTERCNLRCRHCYQTGRTGPELALPEIRAAVGHVADTLAAWEDAYDIAFSRSFNVTGGEPFLREDIFYVLKEIGRRGFDIYVLSNGILIDAEGAGRLAEYPVRGVQVSFEGPEEIHEAIRGKGTFAGALRGVRHLLDAGLTVTMNVTLSTINGDYLEDMIELAASTGVQRLGFSRLVPSGRGRELRDRMLPTQEVRTLYERIFSTPRDGLEIVTGDPVASQIGVPSDEIGETGFPAGGCAAGVSGLTVLPDGTLTPCRRLPIPIGNVMKDSLREVWATSPVLESLREKKRYKGRCGTCRRWARCRGCRAVAYAYSQAHGEPDYLAEDPQCFIQA
jgi:AdoMet-dependent heme synthase